MDRKTNVSQMFLKPLEPYTIIQLKSNSWGFKPKLGLIFITLLNKFICILFFKLKFMFCTDLAKIMFMV